MKNKKAIITGINGQDGSYLAELLLEKGYDVYGTIKRNSVSKNQTYRIEHIINDLNLEYADITDLSSLYRVFNLIKPDEIYNLAAQSHVGISFNQPIYTTNTVALGALNILEAMKECTPNSKLYQASSSEMFGNSIDTDGFQRENTQMIPVSPYGCAKLYAYNICNNYKNSYNLFISNGILFNHESPRRGENFVTNKIIIAATNIKKGIQTNLHLGNLNAARDWGHAKDYVKAMWLILQQNEPNNFVCSTGISHTVQDVVEYVFNKLDLNWQNYVKVHKKYIRPEELNILKGDSSKIENKLKWSREYTFETTLDDMIFNLYNT